MSHSVFCVLGDPVHSASLHRHGNVQCTEASACFVDLDCRGGRHRSQRRHGDPYQPGADGFWFWFWERAVIGGRGGTRRTTGLKHRSHRWTTTTLSVSPARAESCDDGMFAFWEGFPMDSHLSKSHATCEPGPSDGRRGWWSKRHDQPSRVDFKGLVRGPLLPFLALGSGPSCVMYQCFRVQARQTFMCLLLIVVVGC